MLDTLDQSNQTQVNTPDFDSAIDTQDVELNDDSQSVNKESESEPVNVDDSRDTTTEPSVDTYTGPITRSRSKKQD